MFFIREISLATQESQTHCACTVCLTVHAQHAHRAKATCAQCIRHVSKALENIVFHEMVPCIVHGSLRIRNARLFASCMHNALLNHSRNQSAVHAQQGLSKCKESGKFCSSKKNTILGRVSAVAKSQSVVLEKNPCSVIDVYLKCSCCDKTPVVAPRQPSLGQRCKWCKPMCPF